MAVAAPSPYYRVRLEPPPKTLRLRDRRYENFRYRYDVNRPRVFEINYLLEGNLCEMREDGEFRYEQSMVHTLVENRQFEQYSTTPVTHELYLYVALAEPAVPMTAQEVCDWVCTGKEAIIPEYITDPALCARIAGILKAHLDDGSDPLGQLKLRLCLQELLILLTQYAVAHAGRCQGQEIPGSTYTQKACQYIQTHLAEKLTVAEVAAAAGISYSHLKTLFRQDMGMTVVKYINNVRLRVAETLLLEGGLTLEEAGAIVGIHDPAYLSRLFRKNTGKSVRQHRRNKE